MKKTFLSFIIIIAIAVGVGFGIKAASNGKQQPDNNNVLSVQSTQSEQKDNAKTEETIQPGIPQTVKIPKIDVQAEVESVGMDSQGRMDVPNDADNTAWFSLGYRPGQKGNAVLDGHYDKQDGSPAVFWDIGKLEKGDSIIVTDDKGKEQTFAVIRTVKYPYDDFPIQEVFGNSSESMLNLITCHGDWNETTKNYSERMVVYSQLVD